MTAADEAGKRSGHRQIEHTADLALELWAPTREALFVEGARAIVGLLTEAPLRAGAALRSVTLESFDAEDGFVQWLNEVLALAVPGGFLVSDATVRFTPTGLEADLVGDDDGADRIVTELKAVTYHDLLLEESPAGWRARVVIDV